jgi:competence protein ComGC
MNKSEKKNKEQNNSSAGFTLVEIMTSMTIFIVLVAIFGNFFSQAIKVQRRSLASYEIVNTASYNLEYMSRAIRMAKKDLEGGCIEQNYNYENIYDGGEPVGLKFMNYDGTCRKFFLAGGRLFEEKNGELPLPLTPIDLTVDSFIADRDGSQWGQEDPIQPKVLLILEIEGFKFQTIISQRNLNVQY